MLSLSSLLLVELNLIWKVRKIIALCSWWRMRTSLGNSELFGVCETTAEGLHNSDLSDHSATGVNNTRVQKNVMGSSIEYHETFKEVNESDVEVLHIVSLFKYGSVQFGLFYFNNFIELFWWTLSLLFISLNWFLKFIEIWTNHLITSYKLILSHFNTKLPDREHFNITLYSKNLALFMVHNYSFQEIFDCIQF